MSQIYDDAQLVEVVKDGGVILYPTDTVWGIGCDATNADAVERVYDIKKRPKEKSMIVLFSSEEMLSEYGITLTEEQKNFLSESMKPTTMIVDNITGLADNAYHQDGSVGIRIITPREGNPGSVRCYNFIEQLGKPLISTSANISGDPTAKIFDDINDLIKNAVDGYPSPEVSTIAGEPSQIVRIDPVGKVTIVRA